DEIAQKCGVEKARRLLVDHPHLRRPLRIELVYLEHLGRVEVARIERWIHRRREPHEPTAAPLPERETDLELGGGLVDFVDDDRVRGEDVVLLEPTARDSRRDEDEI